MTVTEPELEYLRRVLGDAADSVDAAEEHHGGAVRTISGRVGRLEAVRTRTRREEPGSKSHVYEPSTMRRDEIATMADVAMHATTGFLVEVLPAYKALVWLDDALEVAVGHDVTWPTTGPDPAVVRQALGHRARAVTHRVELGVEPLKLRKVTGMITRIEAFYYYLGDGDLDSPIVPAEVSVVDRTPVPPSPDGWRETGYLVTLT